MSSLLSLDYDESIDVLEQDEMKADKILQSNDPVKIIKLLKKLWISKKDLVSKINRTNQRTCNEAITMLSQEIAVVYNLTEEKAEEKLLSILK